MNFHRLGRTDLNISPISIGGASLGQQYGPVSVAEAAETLHAGIDAGINLIDTSAYYGKGVSEEILGEVLSGGLRDKVAICTKAGRLDSKLFDFTPQGMRKCFEGSLRRLRTDHVEILLAHDIEFADDYEKVFTETAEVLHQLKKEGKCRYIGMSCYPLGLLRQAIERCNLDVIISYCHYNLQNQRLVNELLPIALQHGVGVLNASPLGMGLLTRQGTPPWHPAPAAIKDACRVAAKYCEAKGADISYLGMQFCFRDLRIPSTITGTAHKAELQSNLKAMMEPMNTTLLHEVQDILKYVNNISWHSGNYVE